MQKNAACIVCNNHTRPYFTKDFKGNSELEVIQYCQCKTCGFVFSLTHYTFSNEKFSDVNHQYHMSYFGTDTDPNDHRWLQRLAVQTNVITYLAKNSAFNSTLKAYDYGCGDGKLADMITKAGFKINKYDKYLLKDRSDYLSDEDIECGNFGLVINTSVMEHIRDIETLDSIAKSVHPEEGVLAIHTLIRETVPQDPNWFYLLPVHVSFFTNHSMEILTKRWGFTASVYILEARMWFLFRSLSAAKKAYDIAQQGFSNVYYKQGFMDYWKDGMS